VESYVLFLLLGLGAGAVYAILGLGLVLEYRSSGVINFAQGALAMFIAYVYLGLRTTGELMLPVAGLPSRVSLFDGGLSTAPAFLLALGYAAALGFAVYMLIFRPLRHAPPLARLVASVGLMIALQAMIVLNIGDDAFNISGQSAGNILPNEPVEVFGTMVPRDRFYLAGLTALIGLALWAVFRFTTFGLATRAAAETEKGAAVCGYSSTRLGATNWIIATVLAGAAGILITPISGIEPTTFTLFIVPALGAALLGRLTSFSVTLIAGLTIGMLQSEITKLTLEFDWLPRSGLQQGLPFIAIIVALVVFGRSIPWRNALVDRAMPAAGRPRHIALSAAVSLAGGVVALFLLGSTLRLGLIQSLITVIVGLSLVVVTGLAGQISLAQMAFAGFGGFMFAILVDDLSLPFPLALLLAGLATAPLALVVGLPSLRTRGVHLAVLTLAAAVALDAFLFSNTEFTGGAEGRRVPPATIFGIDLNVRGSVGTDFPRPAFGVLVLVIAVAVGCAVALVRRGAIGRQMLATRANERAALAAGVSVSRTKLIAFAVSGFIAGLAGSMTGLLTGSLAGAQFQVFTSLLIVALVYIGGVARISGAVVAALFFVPKGFGPTLLDEWFGIGKYAILIGGLGLILTSILEPNGLSVRFEHGLRRIGRSVRPRASEGERHRVEDSTVPEPKAVEAHS
jgi:ABC-type branched-subunit amino acid transport system permease subunit